MKKLFFATLMTATLLGLRTAAAFEDRTLLVTPDDARDFGDVGILAQGTSINDNINFNDHINMSNSEDHSDATDMDLPTAAEPTADAPLNPDTGLFVTPGAGQSGAQSPGLPDLGEPSPDTPSTAEPIQQ